MVMGVSDDYLIRFLSLWVWIRVQAKNCSRFQVSGFLVCNTTVPFNTPVLFLHSSRKYEIRITGMRI